MKDIKELVAACKKNRVDFVWAIHPGKDIKWNEEDYQNLKHKLDLYVSSWCEVICYLLR